MNRRRVLEKTTYPLLRSLKVKPQAAKKLSPILCNMVLKYGLRNQSAVVNGVIAVAPYFADISDTYFARVKDILNISVKVDSQYYDLVTKIVVDAADLSTEEKLKLVTEEIRKERKSETENTLKITIVICVFTLFAIALVCAVLIIDRKYDHREQVLRTWTQLAQLKIRQLQILDNQRKRWA